jgi:pimeloyl-ACP methyl ester carboxylesterase
MPCEDVSFTSRDGTLLGGWWIPTPDAARGTVILCPGQNGSMDQDVPQVVPLHQAGFNILMFDWRAHGRSEGKQVTMGVLEQLDLRGALDYLQTEHGIGQVGVLGFSMGAGISLLVAAQDDRIRVLVVDGAYPRLAGLLTAWGRVRGAPEWMARGMARLAVWVGSLRCGYQLDRANPVDLAPNIKVPMLFIHGDADPFVPDIDSLTARIAGPHEIWRVSGAGHREAFSQQPDEYNRRVVPWFTENLNDG